MRARLLAAALTALAAVPCAAGPDARESSAVLWIPAASSASWRALDETLSRFPRARLTLALDPEEIPAEERARLADWVRQGRVEAALRLTGRPLLPLLARQQPGSLAERLALAKARYRQIFGTFPMGFVPADGVLTAETAAALARAGIRWAAAGDSAEAAAPWVSGALQVIPFHALSSTPTARIKPGEPPRALVLDETGGVLPPGAGPALAAFLFDTGFFDSGAQSRWGTVSEVFVWAPSSGAVPKEWPNWAGADPLAPGDAARDAALTLGAQAAAQLDKYQNSGLARLELLNKASAALYAAEDARFYAKGALKDPALEREFRARLREVFKAVRSTPPETVLAPLEGSSGPEEGGGGKARPREGSPDASELEPRVRSKLSPGRLWFENPEGKRAIKGGPQPLPSATTTQDLWSLKRLDVLWDAASVTFTFSVKRLDNLDSAPAGFSPLMLDLYMDVNHLPGRGATSLLPERKGFLRAADAWEYALVLTGFGGGLYRSSPGGEPVLVEKILPSSDLKRGEIKASISRARLRGNPSGWGYLLLALATDSARARQEVPLPLPAPPDRPGPVLGLLGETADQQMLSDPKTQFLRFSALRIEKREGER